MRPRPAALLLTLALASLPLCAQYTAHQMESLGGGSGRMRGISDLGHVAGISASPGEPRQAFFWTAETGPVDLGTLGGDESEALGVNNLGMVVGWSLTAAGERHAFLFTADDGMIDLGTLGGNESEARRVNGSGQIVGRAANASGEIHAFIWTAQDGMIDLGTLGGDFSSGWGINELGHAVGRASTADSPQKVFHAFLWTPEEGMIDLGVLGEGTFSEARGVNNAGEVVGFSKTARDQQSPRVGFYWSESTGMIEIGTLGGSESRAYDTNELGQAAVGAQDADSKLQAAIWTLSEGMVDLGVFTGAPSSEAFGIDGLGRLVGVAQTTGPTPALWTEDLAVETTSLFAGSFGQPYSAAIDAGGGLTPYSFTLLGGALPVGLAINALTGEVAGTPVEAGAFDFTVGVTDALGTETIGDITLTIDSDSVAIVRAFWRSSTGVLIVRALSSADGQVTLTAEGFGALVYVPAAAEHRRAFPSVATNPGTITVTSSGGGSDTAVVEEL